MARHGTSPLGFPNAHHRARRSTMGTPLKVASFALALLIALGGAASAVYMAGTVISGKADRSELAPIREDVVEIKTELRMYINAQRPDLLKGRE